MSADDTEVQIAARPDDPTTGRLDVRVHEEVVASRHEDVRVRVYTPEAPVAGRAENPGDESREPYVPRAALVWAHGGGFVHGDLDMPEAHDVAREIAARAGAVVVSVDYLLSGDGRGYPEPHTQLCDVLEWTRDLAVDRGVDPGAVSMGGASAGACIVLGATLALLDEGRPLPAGLLLAYPAAHRVLRRDPALAPPAHGPDPVTRFDDERMAEMFATYANGADPAPYLSADGRDLTGLPPLLVHAAELDDLVTSAEDLVARARRDGGDAELVVHLGETHGYLNHDPLGRAASATHDAFANFL